MIFYIVAVVMTIGAFSVEGVVTRTWPFIDLIRSFEVNLLFERFESLLLVIWIMQIFCTFCISFYGAALGISQIFNKKLDHCLFALLPLVFYYGNTSEYQWPVRIWYQPWQLGHSAVRITAAAAAAYCSFQESRIMKRIVLLAVLLIQSIGLSGCWSSTPIENLNMEVAVALDIADETLIEEDFEQRGGGIRRKTNVLHLSVYRTPRFSGFKKEGASSRNFYNMTETGDSVFEAIRELSLRTNNPPIGHHLKIIVIGEQLARSTKLSELIDFFSRDNDIRPSVLLLVSKGKASDVLNNVLPGQTPAVCAGGDI